MGLRQLVWDAPYGKADNPYFFTWIATQPSPHFPASATFSKSRLYE